MTLTRRELLFGGMAASVAGLYRCSRFQPDVVGGPYDVAVVGSGFAGTYLALQTASAGLETVIVEAAPEKGIDYISPQAGNPFAFRNTGEIDYNVNGSRVIGVGGTSRHWTGRVNRLRPSDFRLSSEFGLDVDWPIAYEDLAPYYCEAERLLSVFGGPMVPGAEPRRNCPYPRQFEHAYRPPEIVVDGEALPFFGVATSARSSSGQPVRLAEEEIPRFTHLAAATMLAGFQVTRIATLDGETVDHLVLCSTDGKEHHLRARCFVLAAGVIETPRLLLRSRSRWFPDGLGNSHDLVGRFFVEHPTLVLRFTPAGARELAVGAHRTYHFNDRFRSEKLNACHYQLRVGRSGDVDWKLRPETQPRPENRVTLSGERRDRFGSPTIELAFGFSGRDRRSIERGMEFLRQEARALGAEPSKLELGRWFRDHPAGTCRMGFDPSDSVVDRHNRVFGV